MRAEDLSTPELPSDEIGFLQDTAMSGYKDSSIRLREGEYQYSLAKAIASFHFEMYFPDVKDIIKRSYGEEKAKDLQFVRKVQTVLKKMERSGIVRILPKSKPWELQRYSLCSFKFQDSDKNNVSFATDEQIAEIRRRISEQSLRRGQKVTYRMSSVRLFALSILTAISYVTVVWALLRPAIEPILFIPALGTSVLLSLFLGEKLSPRSGRKIQV
jgi:hypothetical protein